MTAIERRTAETRMTVSLAAPAEASKIDTSIRFLDHMLRTLARYSGLPLVVEARGDLRHHIIEDVAICVGQLIASSAPVAAARFGDRTIPMDDALVHCSLDFGGRSYYRGPLPSTLYDHWMRSFAENARCTLHLRVLRGVDRHHVIEAAFKALGLCLREALAVTGGDGRGGGGGGGGGDSAVFSTKGQVAMRKS